jgi:hypothetical protein
METDKPHACRSSTTATASDLSSPRPARWADGSAVGRGLRGPAACDYSYSFTLQAGLWSVCSRCVCKRPESKPPLFGRPPAVSGPLGNPWRSRKESRSVVIWLSAPICHLLGLAATYCKHTHAGYGSHLCY